jgi:hypothetical protein
MTMEKGKKTRISLDLSQSAFGRLEDLESVTDANSKADLIREALRLYEYLVKQSIKGSKVQCVAPDGSVTEVFATSLPTPAQENSLVSA